MTVTNNAVENFAVPGTVSAQSATPDRARSGSDVSELSLERVASRLGGFVGEQAEPVNREELIMRGMSNQQVDAVEVQRHQNEILHAFIYRWLICFFCSFLWLGIAVFSTLIWLAVSWSKARSQPERCDTDLIDWGTVVIVFQTYHMTLHSLVIRCVCGYNQNEEPRPPQPWRVVLFNVTNGIFGFGWNIGGVILASQSEDCREKLPSLHKSVLVFSSLSIIYTVFFLLSLIGIQQIAAYMLRHGMLSSAQAAPTGTFDQQKVVKFGDEALGDVTQCSICLDDFGSDPSKEIRQTSCGNSHFFHATCLQGWLKVGRTCPMCRQDLAPEGDTLGKEPPV